MVLYLFFFRSLLYQREQIQLLYTLALVLAPAGVPIASRRLNEVGHSARPEIFLACAN